MTENIRTFTKEGTQRFAEFIAELRFNPTIPVPFDLLTDDAVALPLSVVLTVSNDPVSTKMELAQRLDHALGDFPQSGVKNDVLAGMWNWLALFFFESLAPNKKTGSADRLILNYDWKRRTRHLVESPYNVFKMHGVNASVVLENDASVGGELVNKLSGTLSYWTNQRLFEFIHRIYWDFDRKKPKVGLTSEKNPCSVYRLVSVLDQFSRTYDLHALTVDEFTALMPSAFSE